MTSLPGQVTGQTYSPINVLFSTRGLIEGSGVIDSTQAYDGSNTNYEDEIRSGTPLARNSTTKLWAPCKRTTVTSGGGATSATVPVVDAQAFRAGDTGITVGTNTGLTVASVNYPANSITFTASITFANSSTVHATDGTQTCLGILNEFVKLKDVHFDGLWRNKPFAHLVIAGEVDASKILGDLAAIRADTGAQLQQIIWNDLQGQI